MTVLGLVILLRRPRASSSSHMHTRRCVHRAAKRPDSASSLVAPPTVERPRVWDEHGRYSARMARRPASPAFDECRTATSGRLSAMMSASRIASCADEMPGVRTASQRCHSAPLATARAESCPRGDARETACPGWIASTMSASTTVATPASVGWLTCRSFIVAHGTALDVQPSGLRARVAARLRPASGVAADGYGSAAGSITSTMRCTASRMRVAAVWWASCGPPIGSGTSSPSSGGGTSPRCALASSTSA